MVKIEKFKKCLKCGRKLSESEFYNDVTHEDGLSFNCKKCVDGYFKQFEE